MQNVSLEVPQQITEQEVELNKKDIEIENPELQANPFDKAAEDAQYTPIAALTSNTNDWIIKARLSKKYDRKAWNNQRGSGQLLNIDLVDQYGSQIQATMFKDAVDKFDPILKENNVYTFSNGTIKLANLKFSSIKNDFSIVLDPHAKIVEVMDDESIQSQAYCFQTIN